jgi:hypothetical protein
MTQGRDEEARRIVRGLLSVTKESAHQLMDAILGLREDAIAPLLEILEDETLQLTSAQGEGMAPVHAVRLLGELRAVAAVEPMLRALRDTDWQDVLHDELYRALPAIGAAALEPALLAYAEASDPSHKMDIASVLCRLGVQDERIFTILLEILNSDPERGAMYLADYGDERGIEPLSRAFDAYEIVEGDRIFANQTAIEIRAAIEELGGALTPEQQVKLRKATNAADTFRRTIDAAMRGSAPTTRSVAVPVRRNVRPGRNEACWCGSSRKYKKCHLSTDEGHAP